MSAASRRLSSPAVVLLLALAGSGPGRGADAPFAPPENLQISTLLGWIFGAADLDRDGDLDLVGLGNEEVGWLERGPLGTYSLWHCYSFPSGSYVNEATLADLDGDGDQDIVVYRVNDEEDVYVDWLENDGTPAVGSWTRRNVGWRGLPLFRDYQWAYGMVVADIDGDGDLDVAAGLTEVNSGVDKNGRILWYENDGAAVPGFSEHTIQDWWDERPVRALAAGDLDGDGDLDLAASIPRCDTGGTGYIYWYVNDGSPGNGAWSRHEIDPGLCGPALDSLDLGDFDRDGDLDLLGMEGYSHLMLFENDGTPVGAWASEWLFPNDGYGARFGDLNDDGWLDLVIGGSSCGWFDNERDAFTHRTCPGEDTGWLADLDRDGDTDHVYADWDDVRWVENLTIHRSGRLLAATVVDGAVDEAFDAAAVDLDRDGDLDLVSVSEADDRIVLHRNDGTPGDGGWSNVSAALAVDGARAVAAGDLDGDGDPDLVAAAYNENGVFWYESDGTPFNGGWTERSISLGAGGADDVLLADLDGDGDLDVACAQYLDDEISWYRNNGGSPPSFASFFVDGDAYDGPRAVAAGDLDGDGDLDLAAVSETADAVVWYTNDGTPDVGEWARHRTDNGDSDGPKDVALADLDRDGDLDTLVANYAGDDVLWYENDGTLAGWTAREIAACGGARGIASGDFDRDGDLDVLLGCFDDDTVKLQRSNGGSPPDLTPTISTLTGVHGARSVLAADLDRDGDLDAVAVEGGADTVAWFENRGGQFRVTGVAAGAEPLYNDELEAVLRATAVHRGRAGDGALELTAIPVRLEQAAGDPLNAFQAASLIDTVRVYGDDGDAIFEPATDPLVGSVSPAAIDATGVVWVDLLRGQAATRVGALEQRTFHVVFDLAQPFGLFAGGTRTIRATLLTGANPACEAVDADHDLPLDVEWSADAATPTRTLVDVVFRDGFETGNAARWSASAP
ncbi:MAG: VCBS repeat-containing protein [Thermoanaerobaculia bacterium]